MPMAMQLALIVALASNAAPADQLTSRNDTKEPRSAETRRLGGITTLPIKRMDLLSPVIAQDLSFGVKIVLPEASAGSSSGVLPTSELLDDNEDEPPIRSRHTESGRSLTLEVFHNASVARRFQ
jgi:hypothetical protein